jgi:hypothetical protein
VFRAVSKIDDDSTPGSFTNTGITNEVTTWSFYLTAQLIVFEPDAYGAEAGIAATFVVGSTVYLLPASPGVGADAGFQPGLVFRTAGSRQVMLTGSDLETPEMTTGGSEGDVLTFHEGDVPTWEPAPGAGADLATLGDVVIDTPAEGDVLTYDAYEEVWVNEPLPGQPVMDVQTFTSDGTWTKPTGDYRWVRILAIGGGGGGGSGRRGANGTDRWGGAGGGGGGVTVVEYAYADMAASYAVTIGQGGGGGAGHSSDGTDGNDGTAGGATFVGATAATAIAGAGGGGYGTGGSTDESRARGRGGVGTYPGGMGAAGNDLTGIEAGVLQTNDNFTIDLPQAGGAGGGGGGGGKSSADTNYNGGAGGLPGALGSRTAPAGAVVATSAAVAGTANTSSPAGPGPGGGGGGGAGSTGAATTYTTGANGGLYGGGGGGGGAQNNSGTTGAGGDGADGVVVIWTY